MNYNLLLIFFLIPFVSFSQELSDKELLDKQLPMMYKMNCSLFPMDKYYKKYEKDTLGKVEYFNPFNKNGSVLNIDNLECDLALIESTYLDIKTKGQVIDFSVKVNTNEKLPDRKIKIIKHNLTDSKGKKMILRDSIGHSKGGGFKVSYQIFHFKNLGVGKIKGFIDLQFEFLTGYKNYKINRTNGDSLIRIENRTIKIVDYKDNYILLKGNKTLLQNLEYSNLTNDSFPIVATDDKVEIDLNSIETSGNGEVVSASYSSPSSKTVLPSQFFNHKIKNMTFEEYKLFFNENIEAFDNSEHLCLIKFNAPIINLFLHLPKYENKLTKRIEINSRIIQK